MKRIIGLLTALLLISMPDAQPVNWSELSNKWSTPVALAVGAGVLVGSYKLANRIGDKVANSEHERVRGMYDQMTQRLHNPQWSGMCEGRAAARKGLKAAFITLAAGGVTAVACGVATKIALKHYSKAS